MRCHVELSRKLLHVSCKNIANFASVRNCFTANPENDITSVLLCSERFLISGGFSHGYDITPTIPGNIWESEFCIACVHSIFNGMTMAQSCMARCKGEASAEIPTKNFFLKK